MTRPSLEEATELLLTNAPAPFRIATETLFDVTKKAAANTQPITSLNTRSQAFTQKVQTAKGAVRFLRAIGFELSPMPSNVASSSHDNGEPVPQMLLTNPDPVLLQKGKIALKECVKAYAQRQEAARAAENAAAARKLAELKALSKANRSKETEAARKEREVQLAKLAADRHDYERQRDPTNLK